MEQFVQMLKEKNYEKLNNVGTVFNVERYSIGYGDDVENGFQITFPDYKLSKWYIDNIKKFVKFDMEKMNKRQIDMEDDQVTFEDVITLRMESMFNTSIYNGHKDVALYILKQHPNIDKHSFDYTLTCSALRQTSEMMDTLLAIDDKHYIMHNGKIHLHHWI